MEDMRQAGAESVADRVTATLGEISGLITHYDPEASVPTSGVFVPIESTALHPALVDAFKREYSGGLFKHQAAAIDRALGGTNTVVATRTSSGKSLIYLAPVFDALLRDIDSTALFIYPQKALANDQHSKLTEIAKRIEPLRRRVTARPYMMSRYDG